MKINLARFSGFCFGVKRAIDIALKTACSGKGRVYMLGDIVHNEDVIRKIKGSGIRKIGRLARGKDNILLICAHGAARQIYSRAGAAGYKIVDATCPMVKQIHRIASRVEKNGYRVIIIGDEKHSEVRGIIGQLKKKALLIDPCRAPEGVANKIRSGRCAVVVQSTQNLEDVLKLVGALSRKVKQLKFFNTICGPTRMRQDEIKAMSKKNDVMIIIGSKTSANTRRLYEISRSINQRSYWIRSWRELKPVWFKGAKSAGISAGASTPAETTEGIVNRIKQISKDPRQN